MPRLGAEGRRSASPAGIYTDHHHRQPHLHRWGQRYHRRRCSPILRTPLASIRWRTPSAPLHRIPRATGETRGLNFNGQMYVMGGGRVAPNPSNEVDIYDPGTNTWSIGVPFVNARRNFPTDTDGTDQYLVVRRLRHYWRPSGIDGNLQLPAGDSHANADCDANTGYAYANSDNTSGFAYADTIGDPASADARPRPTPFPRP